MAFIIDAVEGKNIPHCRNNPKSNRKIVDRVEMDTSNTHIHDGSLSWIFTGNSTHCARKYTCKSRGS